MGENRKAPAKLIVEADKKCFIDPHIFHNLEILQTVCHKVKVFVSRRWAVVNPLSVRRSGGSHLSPISLSNASLAWAGTTLFPRDLILCDW
jgi:hypothetical protein